MRRGGVVVVVVVGTFLWMGGHDERKTIALDCHYCHLHFHVLQYSGYSFLLASTATYLHIAYPCLGGWRVRNGVWLAFFKQDTDAITECNADL